MPDRNQEGTRSPDQQARAAYEDIESRMAKAFEQAVSTPSFGALLARSAENVAALTRMSNDFADLVLRNLRIAGRADITRLARQLHRNEDKLERVLQEVESLRDEIAHRESETPASTGNGSSSTARRRSSAAKR